MRNKTDNLLNGSRERERRKTEKSFMPSLAHDDVCLRYDTYGERECDDEITVFCVSKISFNEKSAPCCEDLNNEGKTF